MRAASTKRSTGKVACDLYFALENDKVVGFIGLLKKLLVRT